MIKYGLREQQVKLLLMKVLISDLIKVLSKLINNIIIDKIYRKLNRSTGQNFVMKVKDRFNLKYK